MVSIPASLVALIACVVPAQPPQTATGPKLITLLPSAPPPSHCFAKAQLKDGAVELRVVQPQLKTEQRERVIERNGVKVTEKYLAFVPVAIERQFRVDHKNTRVTTKAGKNVDDATILRALAQDTPVLLSFEGAVEPFYLAVVRDDVLIVVQEKPAAPPGK